MNWVIVFPGRSQFDLWPFDVPNTISTPSVCRYYHGVQWLEWLPVTPLSARGVRANEILSKNYWFIRQHNPSAVLCPVSCQEKCIFGCQNVPPVSCHSSLSSLGSLTSLLLLLLVAHWGLLSTQKVWPHPLPSVVQCRSAWQNRCSFLSWGTHMAKIQAERQQVHLGGCEVKEIDRVIFRKPGNSCVWLGTRDILNSLVTARAPQKYF